MDNALIAERLGELPGWGREGDAICKTFKHKDFRAAMSWLNQVAEIAEREQHHPDIDIRWNRVTLTLTTHSSGGITEKDFTVAHAVEALAR